MAPSVGIMTLLDEVVDVRKRNNVTVSGNPAGRPIVFAHGYGCSQEMWRFVVPHFEQDHRVITFDHVGAGNSDLSSYDRAKYDSLYGYADDVLQLMTVLDLDDAVFVGHSVSAMIGVLAANTAPERFGALVLVGPSPRYVNDDGYIGGFEQSDIDALLDALDADLIGWSQAMAPVIVGNPDRPHLGEELSGAFCAVDPEIARQFARATFLADNRRDLEDVVVPTVVMQCADDAIAPAAVGAYVHERIPGSTFVQLQAKGHCPNLSDPDELAQQIRAHLER